MPRGVLLDRLGKVPDRRRARTRTRRTRRAHRPHDLGGGALRPAGVSERARASAHALATVGVATSAKAPSPPWRPSRTGRLGGIRMVAGSGPVATIVVQALGHHPALVGEPLRASAQSALSSSTSSNRADAAKGSFTAALFTLSRSQPRRRLRAGLLPRRPRVPRRLGAGDAWRTVAAARAPARAGSPVGNPAARVRQSRQRPTPRHVAVPPGVCMKLGAVPAPGGIEPGTAGFGFVALVG